MDDKAKDGISGIVNGIYDLGGKASVVQTRLGLPNRECKLGELVDQFGEMYIRLLQLAMENDIDCEPKISEIVFRLWEMQGGTITVEKNSTIKMRKGSYEITASSTKQAASTLIAMGFF